MNTSKKEVIAIASRYLTVVVQGRWAITAFVVIIIADRLAAHLA